MIEGMGLFGEITGTIYEATEENTREVEWMCIK
jgi:hypothetical protein